MILNIYFKYYPMYLRKTSIYQLTKEYLRMNYEVGTKAKRYSLIIWEQ